MAPAFTIILSTWNRGRHIVPTIKSVLRQTFTDYELLIVGDCCDDDTEAAVRPFLSERVKWRNLTQRFGNQYGPNNAGIEAARGRFIGYLGHDDLWASDHLAAIDRAFKDVPDAAFAVSGCVCYGPPGSGVHIVTGMFDDDDAKFTNFFPPSTIFHSRGALDTLAGWRAPGGTKAPADCDFLLRAAAAGLKFVSTRRITVHKFATGTRYLAYAVPQSEEQALFLRLMGSREFDDLVAAVIARSHQIGRYMGLKYPDFEPLPEGHFYANLLVGRGLVRPPFKRLERNAVLRQGNDLRLNDWRKLKTRRGVSYRWSGANPRPRLLLPLSNEGPTRLEFDVRNSSDRTVLDKLRISINSEPVSWKFLHRNKGGRRAVLACSAMLKADDHSVVEFDLTGGMPLEDLVQCADGRPERLALGDVRLRAGSSPDGLGSMAERLRAMWRIAR